LDTVYSNLAREFNIKPEDLVSEPVKTGQIYYRAEDPMSDFIEHEVCYFFSCEVKELPKCNLEYAFGYSLMDLEYLKNEKAAIRKVLTPWTLEALNKNAL
jgi:isopentenyldiphosphate isomerase